MWSFLVCVHLTIMQEIILLHGALGAAEQLNPIKEKLANQFVVFSFNFEGHGGQPITRPYSIENFAENLSNFIRENNIQQPNIFGYSMGGYVALYHAYTYPNQLNKIITLGTKFNWTKASAESEIKFLDAEKIEAKVPAFAKSLSELHGAENWKSVLKHTTELMLNLGDAPSLLDKHYVSITNKCYLCLGEQDQMVTETETKHVANLIPSANLYLLPNTPHPIDKINVNLVVQKIQDILS